MQRRFPGAPLPWLDLSTGINPVAYPLPALPADLWSRLPTREQHDALIAAAASRYGVASPAAIVAAPGTQALIQLLPRLVPRSKVAVIGPTYEEHEASWRRQGHDVSDFVPGTTADVVVVVNPDNPTGTLIKWVPTGKKLTVVDEAFIDFLPAGASFAPRLPPRTVVLRSFGKTYGLAGLRLGFAIAEPAFANRLRHELGPWAVSGPALAIGTTALADDAWLKDAGQRLEHDGRRLDTLLTGAGFTQLGSTPLFRFVRHDDAPGMVRRLGCHGIHVRSFSRQPDRLRFGLPGDAASLDRLATALA